MTSLSASFLGDVPAERRERFAQIPDLEASLAALAAKGRTAWREIPLDDEDFAAFLGRCLSDEAAADLAALRGDDLWIVCAFGLGVPGAAEHLDQRYLDREAAALARLGAPLPMIEDVLQEIRRHILEMQARDSGRRAYTGRGSLGGWLRVAAVRELNRRRGRRAREVLVEWAPVLVASPEHEPEMALLLGAHKAALTEAFREALASLHPRDRSLLRYHFGEGLSIDTLGELYRVHRSTAARWLARACQTLSERTRDACRRRIAVSEETFARLVGLLESQIGVEISRDATSVG